jgi:hypothetical protein
MLDRYHRLPHATRALLLTVAILEHPTIAFLRAVRPKRSGTDALTVAVDAGVVDLSGGIARFRDPMLASAILAAYPAVDVRTLRRRLAAQLTDLEERAYQLGLGSEGPTATVASALDEAATMACARGAPERAAELLELALRLTPSLETERAQERRLRLGTQCLRTGDTPRARIVL